MSDFLGGYTPGGNNVTVAAVEPRCVTEDVDLACPICGDVMYRPVRTLCNHAFCHACLEMWLRTTPQANCPLCREALPVADGLQGFRRDADLERICLKTLGADRYYERERDTVEEKLKEKLAAYKRQREQLGSRLKGIGALTIISTRVGLVAGAVAESAGLAATGGAAEATVGMAAGVGVAAFFGGMKLAAWLDDQGRYCILRSSESTSVAGTITIVVEQQDELLTVSFHNLPGNQIIMPHNFNKDDSIEKLQFHLREVLAVRQTQIFDSAGSPVDGVYPLAGFTQLTAIVKESASITIVNLLQNPVTARFFKAKKGREDDSLLSMSVNFVGVLAGVQDRRTPGARRWDPEGNAIDERFLTSKAEVTIEVRTNWPKHLLLAVSLDGLLFDSVVGTCRARCGTRYVICEVDEAQRAELQRRTDTEETVVDDGD